MSHSFVIDKGAIGSARHFFFNGTRFEWCDEHPQDVFVFRHRPEPTDLRCLNTLFKLNAVEVKSEIASEQIQPFKTILKGEFAYENIRWQYVLPPEKYKQFLSGLTKEIQDNLGKISFDYHEKVFSKTSWLFDNLDFAAIDSEKLEKYRAKEENPSNKSILESFKPAAGSFAKRVVYDRFGTRTGRLTVESGPRILLLKKEYRDMIVSSYPGGKIFYADYRALEARTFLTILGQEIHASDLYSELADNFLEGKYDRNKVKLAVLALVYGSQDETVQKILRATKSETQAFITKIKTHFKLDEFRSKLHLEWANNGKKIKNFYGRVIDVPEESTIINSYIQSTGVDVSLLGFMNLVLGIKKKELKISPIFLLHDAILLDVHPQHFDNLQSIVRPGQFIPGMKNQFFLQIEPLENKQEEDDVVSLQS